MKKLENLVETFARNVAAQTDAIWRCDARTGNKHAKKYRAAFLELRSRGDTGREAFTVLFKHPLMDVRVVAAAVLLRYRNAEARAVLNEAATGQGLISLHAQQALLRWDEGTWALDPEGP